MLKYQVIARKNPQTGKVQYYAQLMPVTPIDLKALATAISRECTVTIHDIKAVLSALQEKVLEYLGNGMSVRLGDLGSFHPRLTCKGADTPDGVKNDNIRGVRVRFSKSGELLYGFSLKNPDLKIARADSPEAQEEGNNTPAA